MMGDVFKMNLSLPQVSRLEVIRYAGGGDDEGELKRLLDLCISEAVPLISPAVCFGFFDISENEAGIDLGFCFTDSRDVQKNLKGCKRIAVFAATIGIGMDRLMMKYGRTAPLKGLLMQALGTERIEALCGAFCDALKNEGYKLRPRFSPGYGDLPLQMQKKIFLALEPEKKIGLTLTSAIMMSPTKSVTAIVGIEDEA